MPFVVDVLAFRYPPVSSGRIIVCVKTADAALDHRGTAVSDEELQVSLVLR